MLAAVFGEHAPPTTKKITERPLVPWFNSAIRSAITERRRCERIWRRNQTSDSRTNLTNARNRVCSLIKQAKITYYNESIQSCEGDQKKLFNIIDSLLHRKLQTQLPSGSICDIVKSFQKYFVSKIVTIRAKITETISGCNKPENFVERMPNRLEKFEAVSTDVVSKIIKEAKNATCELDPMPTSLLKKILPSVIGHITQLINTSLSSGTVPASFKHALVKPLIKKPSLSNELMNNYRPISNLPFLSKILEKVILKQLSDHMTRNNLHEVMQSAYKPLHSTETALLRIQNDVLLDLGSKHGVVLVLLDLSAAFDTIDHKILLDRLKVLLGIQGTALAWFNSYLKLRTNSVFINGIASEKSESSSFGVPQGSVLGPVLFTIYTMPLSSILESFGLKYHFYADDTQIYLSFEAKHQTSFDESISRIERSVIAVKSWMATNMLKLNADKTEILFITSPYYQDKIQFRDITIGQSLVTNTNAARNIGVIFDRNMLMKEHIKAVCQKSHFHLRNIGLIRKYLTQDSCETLVHSLISTRLDYCNSVLSNLPASSLKPLQSIQNTAARIVSLKPKRSHITPVLRSLHWLPVKQRIVFKVLLLIFRCIHNTAPAYLCDLITVKKPTYRTRSANHLSLNYKTPSSNYSARAFSIYGPMIFNALPETIRDIDDFKSFKKEIKTFLFKTAFCKDDFPQRNNFSLFF